MVMGYFINGLSWKDIEFEFTADEQESDNVAILLIDKYNLNNLLVHQRFTGFPPLISNLWVQVGLSVVYSVGKTCDELVRWVSWPSHPHKTNAKVTLHIPFLVINGIKYTVWHYALTQHVSSQPETQSAFVSSSQPAIMTQWSHNGRWRQEK